MAKRMPFIVAMTGGIASGKSVIAARFAALGVSVIDADVIAREVVQPGGSALAEIAKLFGSEVLDASGALDRPAMRTRVFADVEARRKLESIVHPRILSAMQALAGAATGIYVLLVVPLLAESEDYYDWVDRILVVDVPLEMQHSRLLSRDNITPALAESMLGAQASREERLAVADDVLENRSTLQSLDAAVLALHHRYVDMAMARAAAD